MTLSPLNALVLKSPDFARWIAAGNDVTVAPASHPCPRCGAGVVCAYAEMGAVDYYDTFAHACLNARCGYGETSEFVFLANYGPDGPRPTCPFCEQHTAGALSPSHSH